MPYHRVVKTESGGHVDKLLRNANVLGTPAELASKLDETLVLPQSVSVLLSPAHVGDLRLGEGGLRVTEDQ